MNATKHVALALMMCSASLAAGVADEPLPASVQLDLSTTPHLRGLAEAEVRARLARPPLAVAQQLADVYGHKLDEVAYIPAVAAIGRVRLAKLMGDAKTLAEVERIAAPYRTGEKPSQPTSDPAYAGHLLFAELAEATKGDDRKRYIALAKSAADALLNDDGTANLKKLGGSQMSDAVFMGGPILARVGRLTGEAKYFDAAAAHVDHMAKMLVRDDGLYQHSPLCDAAWGRGNGFPALGLAMILDDLPRDHAQRDSLLALFEQHIATLAPHQDETGCWHQVIDKPESYREYSCTAMIAYAMLCGVRQGWLDRETYQPRSELAWRAILLRTAADGALVDVCTETGKQKTLQDYFDRPAIVGRDDRGGAMGLLLATEMAAWQAEKSAEK